MTPPVSSTLANPVEAGVSRVPAVGALLQALSDRGGPLLHLDGGGPFDDPWSVAGLVALEARSAFRAIPATPGDADRALSAFDRLRAARPAAGPDTGVALLLSYEALSGNPTAHATPSVPELTALEVDAALRLPRAGPARLVARDAGRLDRWGAFLERLDPTASSRQGARAVGSPRDALPRPRYLRAVERLHRHIRDGDLYQANLCRSLTVPVRGSAAAYLRALADGSPAPFSAFWSEPGFAVASLSPERFLRVEPDGSVRTHPIKGTRRRSADSDEDGSLARALHASEKDRAELLMIVDLERNDLGRVCRTATVRVPELARLASFPEVHHLVARVEGRLRPDLPPSALLRAVFPGGSITGAPKVRAMEILRGLEPVRRGFFTGSLFWFGDDGHVDSSLLIRSAVFSGGLARIGAGGGIVADSDPVAEWEETNDKARVLTRALGFEPEEAV